MNVDSFKQYFVMSTQQKGFFWIELGADENRSVLKSVVGLPNFPECFITVEITGNSILANFYLNQAVYSTDTLRLINDFNEHVTFLKAFVAPDEDDVNYLLVSAGDFFVSSEEDGVNAFLKLFSYIQSEGVATFLRPLTIISHK